MKTLQELKAILEAELQRINAAHAVLDADWYIDFEGFDRLRKQEVIAYAKFGKAVAEMSEVET